MEIKINDDIEKFIVEAFEDNYNLLKDQGGHALAPEVKQIALIEIIYYWRKLQEIARNVTETEVKLSLPDQTTPKGKKYTIEGVVDIVRGIDKTIMYDIKTHEPNLLKAHEDDYIQQLAVYAHIWENLREEKLDEVAIIATSFNSTIRERIAKTGNSDEIEEFLMNIKNWDLVIPIDFSQMNVEKTIHEFGTIVDYIEEGTFEPMEKEKLNDIAKGTQSKVATWMCKNCDVRFSCSSYRAYLKVVKMNPKNRLQQFFCDNGTSDEIEERLNAGIVE